MSRPRSYSPRRKLDFVSRRSSSSSNSSVESPKKRDKNDFDLPDLFGRKKNDLALNVNDERSVLQQMTSSFIDSPLHILYKYREGGVKVKIWTRSHNCIRGFLFGYIICFDKHWNLIMKDCIDVFCKPKKSKTPFLRNVAHNEVLPDFPANVPKKKNQSGDKTAAGLPKAEEKDDEREKGKNLDPPKDGAKGDKKKKSKKNKTTVVKKSMKMIFVRGDNVIMISPADDIYQLVS